MKPSVTNWMPMYWGDYHRDTGHLLAAEHGAYLLLIGHIWSTQRPLPDNDSRLCSIARMLPDQWVEARPTIEAFFVVQNGQWRHSRVEQEINRAIEKAERAQVRTEAARDTMKKKREAAKPTSNCKSDSDCHNHCDKDCNSVCNDVPRAGGGGGPTEGKFQDNTQKLTDSDWDEVAA